LNDIILQALSKDPARRFQTAEAFQRALLTISPETGPIPNRATQPITLAASSPVPAVPKKTNRLLYLLAGSLATLALIAVAVVELPRIWHASAGGNASTTTGSARAPQQRAAVSVVDTQPLPNSPNSSAASPPISSKQASSIEGSAPQARGEASRPLKLNPEHPATVDRTYTSTNASAQVPPVSKPQISSEAASSVQQPVSALPANPDAAQLGELRERMMLISARIGAANGSVQTLQRQQAQQGLGLRSDMVALQQRISFQMAEAESDLSHSNAASVKRRLDATERDLEKLETFLGR
jgi:hypothetical protein